MSTARPAAAAAVQRLVYTDDQSLIGRARGDVEAGPVVFEFVNRRTNLDLGPEDAINHRHAPLWYNMRTRL